MSGLGVQWAEFVILTDELTSMDSLLRNDGRDGEVRQAAVGMISLVWASSQGSAHNVLLSAVEAENTKPAWRQQLDEVVAFPSNDTIDSNGWFKFAPNVSTSRAVYASYVMLLAW